MNSQSVIAVIVGILLLIVAGGALWLSNARVMPPTQKRKSSYPMRGFPTKHVFISCFLIGLSFPVFAQNGGRAASFMPDNADATIPAISEPAFSGLATGSEEPAPAHAPQTTAPALKPLPSSAATDVPGSPDGAASNAVTSDNTPDEPKLSDAGNLGAAMWMGTPYAVAVQLLAMANVTGSAALNDLTRRLLVTEAAPPDGNTTAGIVKKSALPSLDSLRVDKLVSFNDAADAWALLNRPQSNKTELPIIDDAIFQRAVEAALGDNSGSVCPALPMLAKAHPGDDWHKATAICQLRAKDSQASATLDFLRAQSNRDDMFLEVADRDILNEGKNLPGQLTPLTPALLALLRVANLPLPGDLYSHPDTALVTALLDSPSRQDSSRLGLAERMAARGIIGADKLGAIYSDTAFLPDARNAPLSSTENGAKLRALLYQAALHEKDGGKRQAYAVKFMQSAVPVLQDSAGQIAAVMLGDNGDAVTPSPDATTMTLMYAQAGLGDQALGWLQQARRDPANAANLQPVWPQFALAGLEADKDFAGDLESWLDSALPPPDSPLDTHVARDNATAALLLIDAAGLPVPDAAWAKMLALPRNDKHIAVSALLLARLQNAGQARRRAETVLLSIALAQGNDIPLPAALAIIRALRSAGFKSEAATFARQQLALLVNKAS